MSSLPNPDPEEAGAKLPSPDPETVDPSPHPGTVDYFGSGNKNKTAVRLPNPDPETVDYFKVDAPADPHPDPDTVDYFGHGNVKTNEESGLLPKPDPKDVDYSRVDAPSDPNPDPETVDGFEVGKTNKDLGRLPSPDPKDFDYSKVDAPADPNPDTKHVDHPQIELLTAENPNPEGVDYYKVIVNPEECGDPQDEDYFRFGKSNKELFDLFYGANQYTYEELLTRVRALRSEIKVERELAGANKSPLSIHDLVQFYAEYVDWFETVLKSSHYAAMLAEGRRYKSHERGYYEVIREQLQLADKDNLNKIPEEQIVEPRERSSEEWNKHQALIRNMASAMGHFDELFTVFQANHPQPDTTPFTTERRVWHPRLRAVHKQLAKPIFGHHTEALWHHMSTIAKFLETHRPDPADAWALEDRKVWYDFQRKGLCRSSAWLLREACVDLQLDPEAVDIEWATLVDPTKLPSYTHVSIDQPEFMLGSPAEEGRPHHHNHSHMGMLQVKRALGYNPSKDPQVNTGAVQANTSKRRQSVAGGGEAGRPAKRQQTEAHKPEGTTGGHAQQAWTRADADADADFHWIESWLGYNPNGVDPSQAPTLDGTTVLKPLLTSDVCDRWLFDFATIRDQVEDLRDRVFDAPLTEEDEAADPLLLDELEDAILEARDELAKHRGRMNRFSQKRTRLAAAKLVYLRALAVRRATVLAEEASKGERAALPWTLRRDLDEHRARRLEDWVAHERAWLEAERFRMSQMKKKAPTAAQYAHLDLLGENISAWTREIDVLRARVAARQESGPEVHVAQAEQDIVVYAEEEQEQEQEQAKRPAALLPWGGGGPDAKKQLNMLDQWFLRDFYTGTIFTNQHWDRLGGRPGISSFLRSDGGAEGLDREDVVPVPLAYPGGRGGLGGPSTTPTTAAAARTPTSPTSTRSPRGDPRVQRPAEGDGVGEAAVHGGADALAVPGGLQLSAGAVHGEKGVGVAGAHRGRAASAGEEGVFSGFGKLTMDHGSKPALEDTALKCHVDVNDSAWS
ncbi:hypothetical protein PG988_007645 [Apiospora saccharicola]